MPAPRNLRLCKSEELLSKEGDEQTPGLKSAVSAAAQSSALESTCWRQDCLHPMHKLLAMNILMHDNVHGYGGTLSAAQDAHPVLEITQPYYVPSLVLQQSPGNAGAAAFC